MSVAFEAVAKFLEKIPSEKGWWYRSPKLLGNGGTKNVKNKDIQDLDPILPHFGMVFGLTEHATALILVEMGCLKSRDNGNITVFQKREWDRLRDLFIVQDSLETAQSRVGQTGTRTWYI